MTAPRLTGCRCQCCCCGEYFGSERGFNRHRIGTVGEPDRRCMSLAELLDAGWLRDARGFLLTPDARRAGAELAGPRDTQPATHVVGEAA